jgi:hypothetical protein
MNRLPYMVSFGLRILAITKTIVYKKNIVLTIYL